MKTRPPQTTEQAGEVLTLDFLRARLRQAESDVATYSVMIAEVEELRRARAAAVSEARFLRVVTAAAPGSDA